MAAARYSFVDLDAELSESQHRQQHSDAEMIFGGALNPKGSVEANNSEDGQALTTVRNKIVAKGNDGMIFYCNIIEL